MSLKGEQKFVTTANSWMLGLGLVAVDVLLHSTTSPCSYQRTEKDASVACGVRRCDTNESGHIQPFVMGVRLPRNQSLPRVSTSPTLHV